MKVHIWIGKSRIAGKGLFAGQDITKETIITRYLGTKISKAQSARALAQGNAYICSLNDRYDIDGNTLKNQARYINHSCNPNLRCGKVDIESLECLKPTRPCLMLSSSIEEVGDGEHQVVGTSW
jgi:hypothetical protein